MNQLRDSLGVPLTPPEDKVVATTWDNEPIYDGEEVYQTPSGDYILADDLMNWVDHTIGSPFFLFKEDL